MEVVLIKQAVGHKVKIAITFVVGGRAEQNMVPICGEMLKRDSGTISC